MMKFILIALLLGVASLIMLFLWMGQGPLQSGVSQLEVLKLGEGSLEKKNTFKIASWNLAYGHGRGSEGDGYIQKNKTQYLENLQKMGEVLRHISADIVLLQEIDFDSKRSHFVDQAETLAKMGGYTYVAKCPSWILNYVPFPYYPISNHFARMHSGGAILSKYPLTQHQRLLFAKPKKNFWLYNLFYLFRYVQKVVVKIDEKEVSLANLHLEAFDGPSREEQVQEIASWAKSEVFQVMAGDFNSIESAHLEGAAKQENEHTLELLRAKLKLKESILLFDPSPQKYYTFPAHAPNRRLDHLFFDPQQFELVSQQVWPAGDLSDHFPIVVELKFK